jgi:hypothetical protein
MRPPFHSFWRVFVAAQVVGLVLMAASGVFPRRFEQTWFVLIWAVLLFPGEFVTPFLGYFRAIFFSDIPDAIFISVDFVLIVVVNAASWFLAAIVHIFTKRRSQIDI